MLVTAAIFVSILATASAACDNGCSGHGKCGAKSVCDCFDNWGLGLGHLSGDCSERICPFELAWVDTPDKLGNHHKYAECANRGICNRGTGECECFPGYEGKGCQRTACPNDCSGHGRCQYIDSMPFQNVYADYETGDFLPQDAKTFTYYGWDSQKTRGCVCDPEYGDIDCSKRLCMYGNDVMDQRQDLTSPRLYQTQKIHFEADDSTIDGLSGKSFALTFKSKLNETFTTLPINYFSDASDFHDFVLDIEEALERLPNRVIDNVEVHGAFSGNTADVNITFVGDHVQGPQNLVTVKDILCGDGCTPKLTGLELQAGSNDISELQLADFNSYECGRRGKCDYNTGLCSCFAGYSGLSCNTIACLV